MSNPIPIDKVLADGNDRALMVLTQPKGFQKECKRSDRTVARIIRHKYPMIAKALCERYKKYNESVKACEQLEKEGKGIIIRPDHALNSYEEDVSVLRQTYEEGYQKTIDQIDRIQKIL